tara:strand:+ start:17 stop:478 length:462 start_codon:yes stop_codon:yes gene_type:complete
MNKNKWGPIIWNFIHVLSYKIKDTSFLKQRNNIIKILRMVFSNLPCPYCSHHAKQLLKNSNLNKIVDKESLIDYLFSFHNNVNQRLKKQIFVKNEMDKMYKNKSFTDVLNDFIYVYNSKMTNNFKFMTHSNSNKNMARKVINIIIENRSDFLP